MPKASKNSPEKKKKAVAKKPTVVKKSPPKKKVTKRASMMKKAPALEVNEANTAGTEKISFSKNSTHLVYRVRTIAGWFAVAVLMVGLFSIVGGARGGKRAQEKLSTASVLTATELIATKPSDAVTLVAVGDILPARYVELKMRALNDYTYPFHKVADFLRSADITFGNLESPIFAGINTPADSTTFRADPASVQGLIFAGFDVMSVANNHTMNYKEVGLLKAINELTTAGIAAIGGGKNQDEAHTPAIINVRGTKIAFYAYSDATIPPQTDDGATIDRAGIAKMDIPAMNNDVKNALKNGADFVVVSMHAGRELKKAPTQIQTEFARAAIDAGASVVLGHHTHVVQPVENYGQGVIFYGLGNFIFDSFFSEDVRTGLVGKITLKKGSTPTVELFPSYLDTIQPRILEGQEKADALVRMGL